jgi:hypothetical protein
MKGETFNTYTIFHLVFGDPVPQLPTPIFYSVVFSSFSMNGWKEEKCAISFDVGKAFSRLF